MGQGWTVRRAGGRGTKDARPIQRAVGQLQHLGIMRHHVCSTDYKNRPASAWSESSSGQEYRPVLEWMMRLVLCTYPRGEPGSYSYSHGFRSRLQHDMTSMHCCRCP